MTDFNSKNELNITNKKELNVNFLLQFIKKTIRNKVKHLYPKKINFSYLVKYRAKEKKLYTFLYNKIRDIELELKTKVSYFIGKKVKNNTNWIEWLYKISDKETEISFEQWKFKKFNSFEIKNETFNANIWFAINVLTLGTITEIIKTILSSKDEEITFNIKKEFLFEIFDKDKVDKISNEKELKTFLYNLNNFFFPIFKRLRNSVMHFENINAFFQKERIQIIRKSKKEKKYILFKNTNNNKKAEFLWDLMELQENKKQKLRKSIFKYVHFGFYISEENKGRKEYIEVKIFDALIWWFN
ncbi:Abi family protein [Mycoplasma sp. 1012]